MVLNNNSVLIVCCRNLSKTIPASAVLLSLILYGDNEWHFYLRSRVALVVFGDIEACLAVNNRKISWSRRLTPDANATLETL